MFEVGIKVTQAETKYLNAIEDRRKALVDVKSMKLEVSTLEGLIDCHEREKQKLIFELKRYTKGKVRSNVLEAELHRKEKEREILKRSSKATGQMFRGVPATKSSVTDIAGIKSHLIQMTAEEYDKKFCKTFVD